jgi:hypothetical protein
MMVLPFLLVTLQENSVISSASNRRNKSKAVENSYFRRSADEIGPME